MVAHHGLATYQAPWTRKGCQLLLACAKCQRKLKRGSGSLRKLKKTLKRRARNGSPAVSFRVLNVGCLKVCPKGGVTVCTQAMLGEGRCAILRSEADVELL